MQVLGVVGPSDSGKTTLVERLATRLVDHGPVATVKHMTHAPDIDTAGKDTARHRAAGATTTYGVTDSEGWFATGTTLSLERALETLAPEFDYALVEGFGFATIPQVELGGREHAGPTVAQAPRADDVDLDAVVQAVDDLVGFETPESLRAAASHTGSAGSASAFVTYVQQADPDVRPGGTWDGSDPENPAGSPPSRVLEGSSDDAGVVAHRQPAIDADAGDTVSVVVAAPGQAQASERLADVLGRLRREAPAFLRGVDGGG